jgi:hypothetical protein
VRSRQLIYIDANACPNYIPSTRLPDLVFRLLLARDRHTEALETVEALLISSPGSPDLLCLRGNCLAAVGNNVGVGLASVPLFQAMLNSHKFAASLAPTRSAVAMFAYRRCVLLTAATVRASDLQVSGFL